jgi:hypothetical protein
MILLGHSQQSSFPTQDPNNLSQNFSLAGILWERKVHFSRSPNPYGHLCSIQIHATLFLAQEYLLTWSREWLLTSSMNPHFFFRSDLFSAIPMFTWTSWGHPFCSFYFSSSAPWFFRVDEASHGLGIINLQVHLQSISGTWAAQNGHDMWATDSCAGGSYGCDRGPIIRWQCLEYFRAKKTTVLGNWNAVTLLGTFWQVAGDPFQKALVSTDSKWPTNVFNIDSRWFGHTRTKTSHIECPIFDA